MPTPSVHPIGQIEGGCAEPRLGEFRQARRVPADRGDRFGCRSSGNECVQNVAAEGTRRPEYQCARLRHGRGG
jgi:hypothetical protein